jgi:hypothetical protein
MIWYSSGCYLITPRGRGLHACFGSERSGVQIPVQATYFLKPNKHCIEYQCSVAIRLTANLL